MEVRLGLITGTGITNFEGLETVESIHIDTPYGNPSSDVQIGRLEGKGIAYIMRHGRERNVPPHRINHQANIWSLREAGVKRIVSTTSVGSLRLEIEPPTIMVPDDYFNILNVPTFFDEKIVHITPGLSREMRELVIEAAKDAGVEIEETGTYVQSTGPRLETPAEVKVIRDWGHIVGMNMASEATLAREIGLEYANISSVDNYGHGLQDPAPTYDSIVANAKENWRHIREILVALVAKV